MVRTPRFLPSLLLGLLAVPLPFLSVLLDSSSGLLYRDLSNAQIPIKAEWVRAVLELHRLPLWDPYHLAGLPFLSDPSYGPLYPLNAFLLFFRPDNMARALVYFIVLHHALLYLGGFWLARDLRARPVLCALGGLLFAWCGYAMSADNLLHLLGAQTAMPFFFSLWRKALRRSRPGPELAGAALALAWPLYAGDPQFLPMAGAAALVLSLRHPPAKVARLFSALLALTFCAAAPQLLPMLAHLPQASARSATLAAQSVWSLHPLRLLETAVPLAFTPLPTGASLAGSELVNSLGRNLFPFVYSPYVGAAPLSALGLYLTLALSKRSRRRRGKVVVAAATGAAALLALGAWSPVPLYALFHRFVPLWSGFRYPERLVYWVALPLLVGAVAAAERLLRLRRIRPEAFVPALAALSLMAAAALAWQLRHGIAPWAPAQALVAAGAALGVIRFRPPHSALALACLCAVDLGLAAVKLVWPQSLEVLDAGNLPTVGMLRNALPEPELARGAPRRFVSSLEWEAVDPRLLESTSRLTLDSAQGWLSLRSNIPAYFGFETATGYGSLTPVREFQHRCADGNGACVRRLAELLSVRGRLKLGARGPEFERIDPSLPFVFSPAEVRNRQFETDDFTAAMNPAVDPRRSVILHDSAPESGLATRELEGVSRGWDRIRIRLHPDPRNARGFLVVNEAFDPRWSAHAVGNGNAPLTIHEANGWAMAVELPASPQGGELVLRYDEPTFVYGLLLFLLWLGTAAWLSWRFAEGAAIGARQVRAWSPW